MKGIILAGGSGSRLLPLTRVTNKHLLPIYNKPMICHALSTLTDAGIKEIMIVSGRGHAGHFLELLGSGEEIGVELSYAVQERAGGIADALKLAKRFAKGDNIAVILGDNIFSDKFNFDNFREGARIYLKEVPDAQRFGVARLNSKGKLVYIIEKPTIFHSNLAVTGLYLYDSGVFDIINRLKPSDRGELEITDVNNSYIKEDRIEYEIIKGFWSDAGTFQSLFNASSFINSQELINEDIKKIL